MPALVAFNRRWRFGSDDLVFPAAGGIIVRVLWLIGISSIFGHYKGDIRTCNASLELELFFIGVIVLTSLMILNEIAIMYVSMQGTVTDVRPRRHMPLLLYIQSFLYLPELSWTVIGTYWVVNKSVDCELGVVIAVWVSVVLQWLILLAVLIALLVLFDPLGTIHGHDHNEDFSTMKESTKQLWEQRCRLMCCCFAGRDDQYLGAISDIADIFACELHDVDIVPSDVAVGLILLQEEQEREEKEMKSQDQCYGKEKFNFDHFWEKLVNGILEKEKPVNFSDSQEKSRVEDAVYFMKFALGSYGWPLYVFMNPCVGPCNLCIGLRCCECCRPGREHIFRDNCCHCNSTGLKLQTDLDDIDLVFCSYQNKIYEVPFYVAVDHHRKAVVVSIRGSLSMQDALTDLTGQGEQLNIEGVEDSFAHKGILKCARYVKTTLEERELLQAAFSRGGEDYALVVVGHSLGAGTASLLSVLLKPAYPNLICFAYSNPGVLSASATTYAEDFTVSVVLGKDVIPRMGVKTLDKLREDLASVIRRCSVPKYRVLMSGCWRALCFFLGPRRPSGEGETSALTLPGTSSRYLSEKDLDPGPSSLTPVPEEKLYPAGKILQIDERPCARISRPKYDVMWADKENYEKIIIHPGMLSDHFPDRVMKALNGILVEEPRIHDV